MLLEVGFSQKEGLKLIQEVNAVIPYKVIPMLCLSIGFAYNQDIDRALLVMKDCCQRFLQQAYMCYIFLAHLRVQELLQRADDDKPILPDFPIKGLELKDPDSADIG